jgi:hypothetical protein
MQADFQTLTVLKVGPEELRVIGLALAGKLRARKDIELASELNLRILEARERRLNSDIEVVRGARSLALDDALSLARDSDTAVGSPDRSNG